MHLLRSTIPCSSVLPEPYEEFTKLFNGDIQLLQMFTERIIRTNNPQSDPACRPMLQRLYLHILKHLSDNSHFIDGWILLDVLSPYLYKLVHYFPEYTAKCLIEVLKEKHTKFVKSAPKQITPDVLIFLKLVPLLYSPSDYYHPVCTFAVMIASEILSIARIKNRSDIALCLLLTTILLEYIQLSKRYIPETINILRGFLLMATENSSVSYVQQFRPNIKMLIVQNNEIPTEWPTKLRIDEIFSHKDIDNTFKLTSLYVTLDLVCRFCKLCEGIPSVREIWTPHLSIINSLRIESDKMNEQIDKTKIQLHSIDKKLEKLQTLSNKPKALRLYEPRIQKIYDGRTFKMQSKEKAETSKLQHRIKREMKSAVREIRKDNSFLSKLKYHEQTKSDTERRQKVKQIYSWGANQAQEINKMAKKNKK